MPFNHTPGPIRAGKPTDAIVSDTDIGTAHRQSDSSRAYYGGHLIAESVSTDNRRRMIAMWNACEGIPTEVLEARQSGGLPWLVADQIDARIERERLLAALRRLTFAALCRESTMGDPCRLLEVKAELAAAAAEANALIAKTTGGRA